MFNISLLSRIRNSVIDNRSKVLAFCRVYNSKINKYTYVGRGSNIINTNIGAFCSIAPGTKIGLAKHPINMISTSPVFYSKKNILKKCFKEYSFEEYDKTVIGNDVWIGLNCIIKSGITIGDGAIIGAGSIVTKDVEPYTIVAGVPAKKIRKRFSEEQINKLIEIKWWEWEDEKIEKYSDAFNEVDRFISYLEKGTVLFK